MLLLQKKVHYQFLVCVNTNLILMSLNDLLDHLESSWNHSEPSEVPLFLYVSNIPCSKFGYTLPNNV